MFNNQPEVTQAILTWAANLTGYLCMGTASLVVATLGALV